MRKEPPKFFEQILNLTEPGEISKIEHQKDIINIYVDFENEAISSTILNITRYTILFKEAEPLISKDRSICEQFKTGYASG
ncbi:hypothetical protein [Petrotoga mobilis]|uniref:hypothetical protein n=1 Tax=Petrotoga mobilis TaxID=69499 RepID=UPI00014FB9EA|nr:hypothetical protein [Petrotoga mobilis]